MSAADYDAWYDTPRGRWIGDAEYRLAARALAGNPGDTLLDVGCGTGWFARRAAADGYRATGLDPNADWLDFARARGGAETNWVEGDARDLPFADASFDHALSIAALCFVDDERQAVAECVRVARRRVVIGWLNRDSLLYRQKGRHGGSGAYRGARWRTAGEISSLFAGLPVRTPILRTAIFLPSGTAVARALDRTGKPAVGRDADRVRKQDFVARVAWILSAKDATAFSQRGHEDRRKTLSCSSCPLGEVLRF